MLRARNNGTESRKVKGKVDGKRNLTFYENILMGLLMGRIRYECGQQESAPGDESDDPQG